MAHTVSSVPTFELLDFIMYLTTLGAFTQSSALDSLKFRGKT